MRLLCGAALVCVLGVCAALAYAEPESHPEVRLLGHGCGATCVAVYARRVAGSMVTFREAQRAADPDADGSCSIGDVQRALKTFGLDVDAYERQSRSLPRVPAILWVSSSGSADAPYDHFIVTEPAARGRFVVHFPPFGTSLQSEDDIGAIWSGRYVALTPDGESRWRHWLVAGILGALLLGGAVGRRAHR